MTVQKSHDRLLFSLSKGNGDFIVQATKGSGAGGQNRNKRETACRVIHPASGAVGFCQEERHFEINRRRAFLRCTETPAFRKWLKVKTAEEMGHLNDIDRKAEEAMRSVKIEVKDDKGRWVEAGPDYQWV
jgi:protein subunit release factor B